MKDRTTAMSEAVIVCTVMALECCGHSFFAHNYKPAKRVVICDDCPKAERAHTPRPSKDYDDEQAAKARSVSDG